MTTLNLALLKNEDVEIFELDSLDSLLTRLHHVEDNGNVWLIADDKDDIIVTENINKVIYYLDMDSFTLEGNIIIHEYESYEEAYKIALMIKETNPKCYVKN